MYGSMPHNCCVPDCCKKGYRSATIDGKEAKVTFHTFPPDNSANRSKRRQWIHAIRRDVGKYFKPSKWTKICSLHFKPTDFYNYWSGYRTLTEDAVPSIFPFDAENRSKPRAPTTRRARSRSSPMTPLKDHNSGSGHLEDNAGASDGAVTSCSQSLGEEDPTSSQSVSARLTKRVEVLEQRLREATEENCQLKEVLQKVNGKNVELKRHLQQMTAESEKPKRYLEQLKGDNEQLIQRLTLMTNEASGQKKLAETRRFCFENIQDSNDDVLFYTGLPSADVFYQLFQYLNPDGTHSNVVYRATAQKWAERQNADPGNALWRGSNVAQGRPANLSQINELFLTLVRLRLNLKERDLARGFEISLSSVSRVFLTWVNYAYLRLGLLPIWPDRTTIQETMPAAFKERYPKTTTILDATEVKVNIPSSLLLQSQTYSNYKSANTFKGLVAISPAGHIMFVSSLYTGNISDTELVERSGFLALLIRSADEVMADRGFTIQELLAPLGVGLNIPPFLGRRLQMDGTDIVETQQMASLRIHIERAIRRVKEFDIVTGFMPASLAGSANQIWTVCALLTNFQSPLLSC